MARIFVSLFIFLSSCTKVTAQICPGEGSKLNYRIIGFSFPEKKGVRNYKVEIADGSFNNVDSFEKNILVVLHCDTNRVIGEVPYFGRNYTWRVVYGNNTVSNKSIFYHFRTLFVLEVDTSLFRLRIEKETVKYANAYVFVDAARTLYDMNGRPVWFLPDSQGKLNESFSEPHDLKQSKWNTITFIANTGIYEINYRGDVLWAGPGNKTDVKKKYLFDKYHHEFTRLANGHYMVLGIEKALCKLPTSNDRSFRIIKNDTAELSADTTYKRMQFGTLIEYDESGKTIWNWKTSKYIVESDIVYAISRGLVNPYLHDNAFFFDEQNNSVYLSFRDISRIVKIKYPEGDILNTYGKSFEGGLENQKFSLFNGQHACKLSDRKYLYLLNNNLGSTSYCSVVVLEEPLKEGDTLKRIWEYSYPIKDPSDVVSKAHLTNGGGGNVMELPDSSMFVATGYSDELFIVGMNKEMYWNAIPEKWDQNKHEWEMLPSYRASIVFDRENLERLIWNDHSNELSLTR